MIRNGSALHAMNVNVSEMASRFDIVHDVDCIYHNSGIGFWCVFEWKNPGETSSSRGTQRSLFTIDEAFADASDSYVGLFIVRLGFSIDEFPLTDAEPVDIVHMYGGAVHDERTYATGAKSAIQHILNHGRLL